MTWDKAGRAMEILLPVIGAGLMIYYEICDTACSSLRGTFLGMDLKNVGILFMAALLAPSLSPAFHSSAAASHMRTILLSSAMGGEIILVRFQILNRIYCPFCLAFGACILLLFALHLTKMNKVLSVASFLAGIGAFLLFFKGSVLPLYFRW